MNAVSNIQTKVIQCKIESVKMYLLPGTDEYTDKTPILELTFKPITGTGAIKQKIVLKGYHDVNRLDGPNNFVDISTCDNMYLIDKKTKTRIEDEEETNHINGVLQWLFNCAGLREGSLGLPADLQNRSVSLLIQNNHIIGYEAISHI